MAFSAIVNRAELSDLLSLASSVIKARSPKPVLQCVKFSPLEIVGVGSGNFMQMSATDLERGVSVILRQIQIESPGEFCVPADKLSAVIRVCPDETVKLSIENGMLAIRGQEDEWKIGTQDAADFPPVKFNLEGNNFTIDGEKLLRAINIAKTCIDTGATQGRMSFMNSLCIAGAGGQIDFVGTSGKSLAVVSVPIDTTKGWTAIIPHTSLDPIISLCKSDTVNVCISSNQASFSADDSEYFLTLLEDRVPPYADIIPKQSETTCTLKASRESIISKLDSVCTMLEELNYTSIWDIEAKGPKISTREQGGTGFANCYLPCKVEGAPLKIGMNPKFLAAFLAKIEQEDIAIEFIKDNLPFVIRLEGITYVQMPINIE